MKQESQVGFEDKLYILSPEIRKNLLSQLEALEKNHLKKELKMK